MREGKSYGWLYATAALTSALSLCGGAKASSAQSGDAKNPEKKKSSWSLQLDARAGAGVGSDSLNPDGFLRATVTAPSGVFLETVNVVKKDFQLDSTVLGYSVLKRNGLTINGVGGGVFTSTGSRSLQAGLQLFYFGDRLGIATPVIGWERRVSSTPLSTLGLTSQIFIKVKSARLGGETSVRKAKDKPTQWSAGPIVGAAFGKGSVFEGALFADQAGDWRCRIRFVHSFTW